MNHTSTSITNSPLSHHRKPEDSSRRVGDKKGQCPVEKGTAVKGNETDSYTICGLEFTENELLLKIGYPLEARQLRLPISRFPSLGKLPVNKRRNGFTMHKQHTVIYWHAFQEKLVARDVVLFGAGLEKKSGHLSEREFIYEMPPPFHS